MKIRICLLVAAFLFIQTVRCDNLDDEITVETVDETPTPDVEYQSPTPSEPEKVYLAEHFDDSDRFEKRWVRSKAKKDGAEEELAKYDGIWLLEYAQKDALPGDKGLVLKSKAKHHAISVPLSKPFVFDKKPLIVQYEVQFQDGQECGGAYLKLISQTDETKDLNNFHDKTPYSIMFGPDKCGNDHKLHFIFRHKNPLNGSIEEKHCKKPDERMEEIFQDKQPHLYTLVLKPDNTFEISVDNKVINSGSLLEDFTPPVNPPEEIDDPNDKKPVDWDERQKIPDPDAVKPDDWDDDAPAQIVDESAVMPEGWLVHEPSHIPDPKASKPEDWDDEMDGAWEPPLIDNPACADAPGCGDWEPPLINNPNYKGKWKAPLIDNPNYMGKWRPRKIKNPDFYEDKEPFKMHSVSAVGFELWSMSKDILFDNLIVTEEIVVAKRWADDTFEKKRQKIAQESTSFWGRLSRRINYKYQAWTIYFIYCMIPIGMYIWYLYGCVKEESLIQKLANITNEYPMLWALYIVILGIPVTLVLYLCFKPSSSTKKENEELKEEAERKKTDELTEDIVEESEEGTNDQVKDDGVEEIEEAEEHDSEKYSDSDSPASEKPLEEKIRKRKVRKE